MTLGTSASRLRGAGAASFAMAKRISASPRFYVYGLSTVLVVLTSYFLGKEMLWDTMFYHVYAGFSALHDRFGQDYFAAGPQGYFNPYAYVPFFLLIRSSFTALTDATILAVLQSAILWLTYELATAAVARDQVNTRVAIGVFAVALAFANPILINEFGSSFIDVTTAEVVLAGWLLLAAAIRAPGALKVACGAILLGAATALKPTNAVHAVAAATLLLFIPASGWRKVRYAGVFALVTAASFVVVNLPWSLQLQRHFGNPVFPLLNGLFRSPEYSTASMLDYRFIPTSFVAALLRPFAILNPVPMIDYEMSAPDVRYALLVMLALALFARWLWRRTHHAQAMSVSPQHSVADRVLAALGCGFLVDWVLWLTASGNGRYFIPMACVAGVLCAVLLFRLLGNHPKARNYALAAIFAVMLIQLYAGSGYRVYLPWTGGPWYTVSVPPNLATQANLYLVVGPQTDSFIIPDMPAGSGFVNLDGTFMLAAHSANGKHVKALIRRYAPHLEVLMRDFRSDAASAHGLASPAIADDALAPYGLKADTARCEKIIVHGVAVRYTVMVHGPDAHVPSDSPAHTEYLSVCRVVRESKHWAYPWREQREADLAFDHLEEACPALFKPRGSSDRLLGDARHGYFFARDYSGTAVIVWIVHGRVTFEKMMGGREENAGSERMWQKGVPRVACSRNGPGYIHILGKRP